MITIKSKNASRPIIVFRVDSSYLLGFGHVSRCLNLARALSNKGVEICFVCRELNNNSISLIKKEFTVLCLKNSNLNSNDFAYYQDLNLYLNYDPLSDAKETHRVLERVRLQASLWLLLIIMDCLIVGKL